MLPVFVRAARPTDRDLFIKWITETPHNEADPNVVGYRSTTFRCAYNPDKIVGYLPLNRPIHLESLAWNPEATGTERAAAIRSLVQDAVRSAEEEGVGEIYFAASEDSLPRFAEKYGFEKLPFSVYRIRVKDFEPKCQPLQNADQSIKR